MTRKAVSKKLRFEVFKRDKFTCQYCGAKAPDVVLNVDHIDPVANGGKTEVINLVTACFPCNNGKGARLLDDASAVERQRSQIEELQARREQLEMVLKWRDETESETVDVVKQIGDRLAARGGYEPSQSGNSHIRRWLKTYSLAEILAALDAAFDLYMKWNGDDPDIEAWNAAFRKVPAIAGINRQKQTKPYIGTLCYIQGILRRRCGQPRLSCVEWLEDAHVRLGVPLDDLQAMAKRADNWDDFDIMVGVYVTREDR